jgi:hypothetical protein
MLQLLLENLTEDLNVVRTTIRITDELYQFRYLSRDFNESLIISDNFEKFLNFKDFITSKPLKIKIEDIVTVFKTNETIIQSAEICKSKFDSIIDSGLEEFFSDEIFFDLKNESSSIFSLKIKLITNTPELETLTIKPEEFNMVKQFLINKISDIVSKERSRVVLEIEEFEKNNPNTSLEELNLVLSYIDEHLPILIKKIESQTSLEDTVFCWPSILGKNPLSFS